MENLDNARRYGVEVEFICSMSKENLARRIYAETGQDILCTYYSDKTNRWRLKSDQSIRTESGYTYAMELVTPILKGEDDMQKLRAILDVCDVYGKVNRSCGVHVHIDITDEQELPLRRIMKFFAKYEKSIGKLLPESRRGDNNGYCRDSFNNGTSLTQVYRYLNGKGIRALLGSRYFSGRGKWNFQNYWRQGTVENRAHSGTLSAWKVDNWVRLTQGIIHVAINSRGETIRQGDTTETYTVKALLDNLYKKKGIGRSVKKFYIKRFKDLNDIDLHWQTKQTRDEVRG